LSCSGVMRTPVRVTADGSSPHGPVMG
jgi:hypothetical protein